MYIKDCSISSLMLAIGHTWQTYVILFRLDSTLPWELNSDILRSDIQSLFPLSCSLSTQTLQTSLSLLHICLYLIGQATLGLFWNFHDTYCYWSGLILPREKSKMFWDFLLEMLQDICGVFLFIKWHAVVSWQEIRVESGLGQVRLWLYGQHFKPLSHLKWIVLTIKAFFACLVSMYFHQTFKIYWWHW